MIQVPFIDVKKPADFHQQANHKNMKRLLSVVIHKNHWQ